MTSDSQVSYQGFLQQTGKAAHVSMANSYPMMVRRKYRLAEQSQYFMMREMMRSQISWATFGFFLGFFQVHLGQSPCCKWSFQYACDLSHQ